MDARITHYGGLAIVSIIALASWVAPGLGAPTTRTPQSRGFDAYQVEAWDPTAPKAIQDYLKAKAGCGLVSFTGAGHVIVTVLHCPQTIAASRSMTPVTLPILP